MSRSPAIPAIPTRLPVEDTRLRSSTLTRSGGWFSRRAAIAGMLFAGTLGATSPLHAGGSASYGNMHFGTVASLTIDIDGSWAAPYASRSITSVDFSMSSGPYASMSGSVDPSASGNGYDYLADGATDLVDPTIIYDRLSARTNFHDWYPSGQDPYPTIKNGFIEFVLNITTAVTIDLYGDGAPGGVLQPGLVVTLDGNSIATGATLAVGTRTLRYTWTNFSQPANQFGMYAALNAAPTAVPGGGLAVLIAGVAGGARRRRR